MDLLTANRGVKQSLPMKNTILILSFVLDGASQFLGVRDSIALDHKLILQPKPNPSHPSPLLRDKEPWNLADIASRIEQVRTSTVRHHDSSAGADIADDTSWSSLTPTGCTIPSRTKDCALACTEPKLLFGSLSTLASCITIAVAAILKQDGTLSLSETDTHNLEQHGILQLASFDGGAVFRDVFQCALTSCNMTSEGPCPRDIQELETSPINAGLLVTIQDRFQNYCEEILHQHIGIDADVAGPGVLLSYVIQTIFVLFAFVAMSTLNSWSKQFVAILYYINRDRWQQLAKWQRRLAFSTPTSALSSTAVEFQEAQGFFTLAVQIATLMTFKFSYMYGTDYAALKSVSVINKASLNSQLVQVLSINSLFPVLLMQSVLQRAGMRWTYTLVITVTVVIFAIIIHHATMLPSFPILWDHLKTAESIPQCGGNPPLTAHCLKQPLNLSLGSIPTIGAAFAMVGILLVDEFVYIVRVDSRPKFMPNSAKWVMLKPWLYGAGVPIFHLIWACTDLALLTIVGLHLCNLLTLATGGTMTSDNWTYGQVVTAMVWTPIFGKYVYYNIFGIQHGFEGRLSNHYRVVSNTEGAKLEE
ncbi:hypothetical protein B0H67DRAFT_558515 [Lasiosphaeris hirsuta]|uniref:Uncharacterized protein n=1 Tax=Lasiosphaeris hirsuta TaxID=260670 RepID=A0AA39ZRA8_9PEZI|nr:hypothetical protein B0H67DRAFT_558515 [Lasiosphaeris hirsuta]